MSVHTAKVEEKTSVEELKHNLARQRLAVGVMRFGPLLARRVLDDLNDGNRGLKHKKIAQFAKDMKNGDWGLTGDSIKFGTDGLLKDGQNRLKACVASGVAFESVVVFGVEPKLFHKMDQGKSRNPCDILQIAGYRNANRLAATLRWVDMFEKGTLRARTVYTPTQILELAKVHGNLDDDLRAAAGIYQLNRFPIGIGAALHREFALRDAAATAEFFTAWQQGVLKGRLRVLEKLNLELARRKVGGQRVQELTYIALAITAWNLFRNKRIGTKTDFSWNPDKDDIPAIQ